MSAHVRAQINVWAKMAIEGDGSAMMIRSARKDNALPNLAQLKTRGGEREREREHKHKRRRRGRAGGGAQEAQREGHNREESREKQQPMVLGHDGGWHSTT